MALEITLLSYVFVILGLWYLVHVGIKRLKTDLGKAGAVVKLLSKAEEDLLEERALLDWWVTNSAYTAIDGGYLGWEYADKQSEWIKIVDGDIRAATRQAMRR